MNVLHIMPSLARSFGGPTQSWLGYARAAKTQGISVSVAAPEVGEDDRSWLAGEAPDVSYSFFRSGGKGAMVYAPGLHRWLSTSGQHFDAIHVHGLFNPISSLSHRLCIKKGWPVILRPFGTLSKYTFNHRRSWMKRQYFQYMDGPNLMRTRGVHFTTQAERDEARWHGIDFSGRSHVVPPPLHQVPAIVPENETAYNVLFLSRLHPKKNVECLLRAWPLVKRSIPSARLIIAGEGESAYVETLKSKASCLGENRHIAFVGFVEGKMKANLLATSSVFVLPSFQENFGVAVIEAIGAGLPVVISPHVQLADYVAAKNLGHVVAPEPQALSASIIEILQNSTYRAYCRRQGPASIQQDFSLENVGRQLAEMYGAVIDQHRN